MLGVVWRLRKGEGVLPGLDLGMADEEWDLLGPVETGDGRVYHCESHPQFQLKLLLDHMGVGRGEGTRWRWGGGRDAPAGRTRAVAAAMTPGEHTGKWQDISSREPHIPGGLLFAAN